MDVGPAEYWNSSTHCWFRFLCGCPACMLWWAGHEVRMRPILIPNRSISLMQISLIELAKCWCPSEALGGDRDRRPPMFLLSTARNAARHWNLSLLGRWLGGKFYIDVFVGLFVGFLGRAFGCCQALFMTTTISFTPVEGLFADKKLARLICLQKFLLTIKIITAHWGTKEIRDNGL